MLNQLNNTNKNFGKDHVLSGVMMDHIQQYRIFCTLGGKGKILRNIFTEYNVRQWVKLQSND